MLHKIQFLILAGQTQTDRGGFFGNIFFSLSAARFSFIARQFEMDFFQKWLLSTSTQWKSLHFSMKKALS